MKKAIIVMLSVAMLALVFSLVISCEDGSGGGGRKKTIEYEGTQKESGKLFVLEISGKKGDEYVLYFDEDEISYGIAEVKVTKAGVIQYYKCYPDYDEDHTFIVYVDKNGDITKIEGDIYLDDGTKINSPGDLNAVNKITMNKTTTTIVVDKTDNLSVTPNVPVTWTSSSTSIATVSETGTVTGVKKGTATITATSKANSAVKATCAVTIANENDVVVNITTNDTTLDLDGVEGDTTVQISFTVTNGANGTVTWASDKVAVASVSPTGLVTAVSKGQATITATSTDDPTAKATVKITVIKSEGDGPLEWLWYVVSLTPPNPTKLRGQSIFAPGEVSEVTNATRAEFVDPDTGLYGWVPADVTGSVNPPAGVEGPVFNFTGVTKVSAKNREKNVSARFPMVGWGAIPWNSATSEKVPERIQTMKSYSFYVKLNSATASNWAFLTAVETSDFDAQNGFDFRHWFGNQPGGAKSATSGTIGNNYTSLTGLNTWHKITVIVDKNLPGFNMAQDAWISDYPDSASLKPPAGAVANPANNLQRNKIQQIQWQIPLQHQAGANVATRGEDPYDLTDGSYSFNVDFCGLEVVLDE